MKITKPSVNQRKIIVVYIMFKSGLTRFFFEGIYEFLSVLAPLVLLCLVAFGERMNNNSQNLALLTTGFC